MVEVQAKLEEAIALAKQRRGLSSHAALSSIGLCLQLANSLATRAHVTSVDRDDALEHASSASELAQMLASAASSSLPRSRGSHSPVHHHQHHPEVDEPYMNLSSSEHDEDGSESDYGASSCTAHWFQPETFDGGTLPLSDEEEEDYRDDDHEDDFDGTCFYADTFPQSKYDTFEQFPQAFAHARTSEASMSSFAPPRRYSTPESPAASAASKAWSALNIRGSAQPELDELATVHGSVQPESEELRQMKEQNSSLQSEVLQLSRQLMTAQRRLEDEGIVEVDVLSGLATRLLHADAESFNAASSLKSFFEYKADCVDSIPLSHKLPESTKEHISTVKRELKEAAAAMPDEGEGSTTFSATADTMPASEAEDATSSRGSKRYGQDAEKGEESERDEDEEEEDDDDSFSQNWRYHGDEDPFESFRRRWQQSRQQESDAKEEGEHPGDSANDPFGFARKGRERRRWGADGFWGTSESKSNNNREQTWTERSKTWGGEETETPEMKAQRLKQEKLEREKADLANMLARVENKFDGQADERRDALNSFLSKVIEEERKACSKKGGSLRSLFRRKTALLLHPDKLEKRFERLPQEVQEAIEETFKQVTGQQEQR